MLEEENKKFQESFTPEEMELVCSIIKKYRRKLESNLESDSSDDMIMQLGKIGIVPKEVLDDFKKSIDNSKKEARLKAEQEEELMASISYKMFRWKKLVQESALIKDVNSIIGNTDDDSNDNEDKSSKK